MFLHGSSNCLSSGCQQIFVEVFTSSFALDIRGPVPGPLLPQALLSGAKIKVGHRVVHDTEIVGDGNRELTEGQAVTFRIQKRPKGMKALDVVAIEET
jgi:cold-shock-like DNA binding protein